MKFYLWMGHEDEVRLESEVMTEVIGERACGWENPRQKRGKLRKHFEQRPK